MEKIYGNRDAYETMHNEMIRSAYTDLKLEVVRLRAELAALKGATRTVVGKAVCEHSVPPVTVFCTINEWRELAALAGEPPC